MSRFRGRYPAESCPTEAGVAPDSVPSVAPTPDALPGICAGCAARQSQEGKFLEVLLEDGVHHGAADNGRALRLRGMGRLGLAHRK